MVDPQRDLAQPTAQRASEFDEPFRPGRIIGHDLDRPGPCLGNTAARVPVPP